MSTAPAHSIERTLFPPFSLSVRERAALDDAALLARLWDAALQASFRLGYEAGHHRGVTEGRAEEAAAWQAIVTGYSATLAAPTRAELAHARRPSNDPCSSSCGDCSQCIRAKAVASNLARYGSPDRPGGAVEVRHRPPQRQQDARQRPAQPRKDRS